jgi:nucleoside-diphosphate-sugar epimerase
VRVFLAGASGVIGSRLVPLLIEAGHEVAGMTRSPGKVESLRQLGAEPLVVDVYDAAALRRAVVGFEAEAVVHQLTDLPDDSSRIPEMAAANERIRIEGTRNLLDAAAAAGASRFIAQSIAWELPADRGASIAEFESMVLDAGGVVLRYGRFYGPDTYFDDEPPSHPRIQIDEAARRTVPMLDARAGTIEIADL